MQGFILPRVSMIIRENARLLFLYALGSNAKCEDMMRPHDFYFRLARKGDIGAIRSCNLKTLPENYSSDFYDNHISDWPELALVAEHVDRNNDAEQPQVVGYVLGRMEDKKPESSFPIRDPRCNPSPPTGHVTSLAVLPGYRRCGVARQLMSTLHDQMHSCYKATKVSLHVRKSNRGAIRLYEELLGYKVAGVASSYYSDGEDAFLLQALLPLEDPLPATEPVDHRLGPLVASAPSGVTLPPFENNTSGMAAASASAPLLRAVAAPALGGGRGGGGGGGGMDRDGIKGVPVGHPFLPRGAWLSRRPGVGCAGAAGGAVCGKGMGWAGKGDTASGVF